MAQVDFDAHTVAPSVGFEPLPAGDYVAIIEASEIKPTKAGTGTLLQCTIQVIEGAYKNRKLWSRLNYTNPNPTAVQIGRAELSAICRAVGVMTPKDTSELHNRPMIITVGFEKNDKGEMQNKITKYAPSGNVQGAVVDGSSKPAPAAAQASATPPWASK